MKSLFVIAQKGTNLLVELLPTLLAKTKMRVAGVAFLTWRPARLKPLGNGVFDRMQIYGIRAWVIRQVIRLRGRARSPLRAHRVEAILKAHAIPWLTIDDVNHSHFLDHLRKVAPDLVLSMFILQRFGSDLLSIPRTGCINLHLGHLPECRGLYSSFWSLYNRERESGVSVHFNDIKTIMKGGGVAMIGLGESDTDNRSEEAIEEAINSPLIDVDISGATGALVNVTGGNDMSVAEAEKVAEIVQNRIAPNARIIWGATVDPSLEHKLRVMLILTGVRSKQILGPGEHVRPHGAVDVVR